MKQTVPRSVALASLTIAAFIGLAPDAVARITRIELGSPTAPFGTAPFGNVGQYEQIDGIAYGELDPNDPLNSTIQDIDLAPRNAHGKVEYSTKVSILKPIDESRGNHTMLFEIVNRGNKLDPSFFNVGVTAGNPAGDGFLENQGFTLVWAGWQADLVAPPTNPNLVTMSAPVAHGASGAAITASFDRSSSSVRPRARKTSSQIRAQTPLDIPP